MALLEYCRQNGRVCPKPVHWDRLWKLLTNRRHLRLGAWKPSGPIILARWSTPPLAKMLAYKSISNGLRSTELSRASTNSGGICARRTGIMSAVDGRSILHLTLEREWFDGIVRGKKDEEYRGLKDYWKTRLEGRTYDIVRFRNGYASDAPVMDVEFLGVEKRKDCYAIRLGKILRIERWRG